MPTIRIPPGIFIGEGPASIPQRYSDGNLIRWQNGNLKPVGGWDRITPTPFSSIPRNFHVWLDENNERHSAYLCDAKVYHEFDANYSDITPEGFQSAIAVTGMGYGSGRFGMLDYGKDDEDRGSGLGNADPRRRIRFSLDNWGQELIFSSSADGRVWVWDPTVGGDPAVAAGAPNFVQCVICTEQHHLMTFGQGGFPNRIAWSGQGNRLDWDYTSVTGSAGFFDLEGGGYIMTAIKIPGAILIFTSTSVWIGRYIGAPYYYGFTKIAEECVPISAHGIAVAGAKVFWMGRQAFWQYEGGVVSPLNCTLGIEPFEGMHKQAAGRKVTAGFNGAFSEVWFFYPKNSDQPVIDVENSNYVIYSFAPGNEWWSVGAIGRSFFGSSPLDDYLPVGGASDGNLFRHEVGYKAGSNPRLEQVWVAIGTISFDDGEFNYQVNQCQVNSAVSPDATKFEFWGTYTRGGPRVLLNAVTPRPDGWLDTHFTAKDFTMRIIGTVDAAWSLGAFNFSDIKKRGKV